MRLIFLFLLLSNIVFSQNATTDQATKQKPPQEIGINLGRYFFSEYGLNGFYKVRKKVNRSTKDNWIQQTNYRFSGGFFLQNLGNQLRTDENFSVRFFYRDSVYSYGISKDIMGNKNKSNSFNFDGRFNLVNSVFVAYKM
jgi:hypothetical protein